MSLPLHRRGDAMACSLDRRTMIVVSSSCLTYPNKHVVVSVNKSVSKTAYKYNMFQCPPIFIRHGSETCTRTSTSTFTTHVPPFTSLVLSIHVMEQVHFLFASAMTLNHGDGWQHIRVLPLICLLSRDLLLGNQFMATRDTSEFFEGRPEEWA